MQGWKKYSHEPDRLLFFKQHIILPDGGLVERLPELDAHTKKSIVQSIVDADRLMRAYVEFDRPLLEQYGLVQAPLWGVD